MAEAQAMKMGLQQPGGNRHGWRLLFPLLPLAASVVAAAGRCAATQELCLDWPQPQNEGMDSCMSLVQSNSRRSRGVVAEAEEISGHEWHVIEDAMSGEPPPTPTHADNQESHHRPQQGSVDRPRHLLAVLSRRLHDQARRLSAWPREQLHRWAQLGMTRTHQALLQTAARSSSGAFNGTMAIAFVVVLALCAVVIFLVQPPQVLLRNTRLQSAQAAVKQPHGITSGRSLPGSRRVLGPRGNDLLAQATPPGSARAAPQPRFGSMVSCPTREACDAWGSALRTGKSLPQSRMDLMAQPPSAKSSTLPVATERETDFCPDLVVPLSCECMLFVPTEARRRTGHLEITDSKGDAVLRAVLTSGANARPADSSPTVGRGVSNVSFATMGGAYGNAGRPTGLMLSTVSGDPLARCVVVQSGPEGFTSVDFVQPSGALFARLSLVRDDMGHERYSLGAVNGEKMHFWGSFARNTVNVSDETGKLFATTEPCTELDKVGSYFRLRVAPLTDVGLVLCGLLCVYCLKGADTS